MKCVATLCVVAVVLNLCSGLIRLAYYQVLTLVITDSAFTMELNSPAVACALPAVAIASSSV